MLRVIDTSHWKGDIVNTTVDIDAVYTKATEGNYYVDDTCDPIVEWAKARGKKWGVYHFGTNCITDAATEANFFVNNCLGYIRKGLLMLDNESYRWSNGTLAHNPYNVAWAKSWLDTVTLLSGGVKPLIYMSLAVIQGADWSPVINAGYGLVCAEYPEDNTPIANFQMDSNRDPNPLWDGKVNDVMWQFTSTGRLDGYGGNLDCNFFYGDEAAWDAYAGVQTAPAPAATPTPVPVPDPQPTPVPEPAAPATDPVPQAPADPSTPANDTVPTPDPLPDSQVELPNSPATPAQPGWLKVLVAYVIELVKELVSKLKKG